MASDSYRVPRALLAKYAKPGPRYTSYPTAPVWSDDFGQSREVYRANQHGAQQRPLALYLHLPFCTSLCWYCGCNVKIARDHRVSEPYLAALLAEIDQVRPFLEDQRPVTQMHWGGGTPTYLRPDQLEYLVGQLRARFHFAADAELSIEIDPRVTTQAHLESLRRSGFNRISLGIQDFDPQVQAAVHRQQSPEATATLVATCRRLGFESINVDLMYGLPFQTEARFATTLEQVLALAPDRLALFHYAHVPWLKPAQKLLDQDAIPDADTKLAIFEGAISTLLSAGYHYIGMDHFARPEDALTQAQRNGSLRRNFMGYTTQAGTDLYGFGVSAISEIDGHFIQNTRDLQDYQARIQAGKSPVTRGLCLSQDDRLRKAVIEELICNGRVEFAQLSRRFTCDFVQLFEAELDACETLAADGLICLDPGGITVTAYGQILIRNVCMVWDAYLPQGETRFSNTL